MQVVALPAGWRRFALADLPRERWRNGAGWTRTVAAAQRAGQTAWRVSLAEISRGAPFSLFPGMDRTAVLVQGGPLTLRGPLENWPLRTPGDLARFAGEWPLDNTPPATDALIWNVMVQRDAAQADVQVLRGAPVGLPDDGEAFAWVIQGRYGLVAPGGAELVTLDAGEGLQVRGGHGGWSLHPASPDACLLRTHLR